MANQGMKFPFDGSVDLFGKPFTVSDASLRSSKNMVSDGEGNLVRRGCMTWAAALSIITAPSTVRTGDGSNGFIDGQYPLWLHIIPSGAGLFATMVSNGARCELAFGTLAGDMSLLAPAPLRTANANMAPPVLLPCIVSMYGTSFIVYGPNNHEVGSATHSSAGLKIEFPLDADPIYSDFLFTGAGNQNMTPHLATICRQKVWWGHFGYSGDLGSTVVVSDIDDPLTVGDNAVTDRNFIIGQGDGDRLTALHKVLLVGLGSPAATAVLALKRNSAHLCTGEPGETADDSYAGTLEINKISSNAGCVSQGSICDTPWGTIWCGPDDVWFLPFGAIPYPIGRALKPLLKAQPESESFRIHAVFAGGFYRLALFSEGQGPNHETPLGEQWWLDLRNGPPENWQAARWYGPMVFNVASNLVDARGDDATIAGTSYMTVDPRPGHDSRLYGIQFGVTPRGEKWIVGDSSPNGLNLVTYDAMNARDVGGMFRANLAPWTSSTIYEVGAEIVVFELATNLHPVVFVCTTSIIGKSSGVTEPNWSANPTIAEITDNEISWSRRGSVLSPSSVAESEAVVAPQSKEYTCGSKLLVKLWQGMELSVLLGVPTRLQLEQMADAGKVVETILENFDRQSGPPVGSDAFAFPTGTGLTQFTEEYQAITLLSDEDDRTLAKSVQLRLTEVPGIYVPLCILQFEISAVVYQIGFSGFYANVVTLADAVLVSLNTALATFSLPGTFTHVTSQGRIVFIYSAGAWAPSVLTATTSYLWSLMGFTPSSGVSISETATQTAHEIAYDTVVGNIGFGEGVIKYRPFSRRPT